METKNRLQTRFGTALTVMVIFSICTVPAFVLGLALRVDHPPMGDLPVYPKAQALATFSPAIAGTGTPTIVPTLTNFSFVTPDAPEQVLAYYEGSLRTTYGLATSYTNPQPGMYVLHAARRALRQAWITEDITITIVALHPGSTQVEVHLNLVP
jgi:hypothetical protein